MTSKYETDENGNKRWYNESGQLHRDGDLPAVILANGRACQWYKNGDYHRENNLPSCIYSNGNKYWGVNGNCYRFDQWVGFAGSRKDP